MTYEILTPLNLDSDSIFPTINGVIVITSNVSEIGMFQEEEGKEGVFSEDNGEIDIFQNSLKEKILYFAFCF